jgi:GR25 family glycosyltransferase involved in LPS biosynthesis
MFFLSFISSYILTANCLNQQLVLTNAIKLDIENIRIPIPSKHKVQEKCLKKPTFDKLDTDCVANTDFDIVFINLARERERRAHMNRILSYCKCNYRIFNAVDGNLVFNGKKNINDYSKNYSLAHMVVKHKNTDKKLFGANGVLFSNYIILKELEISKSTKPLLILEDDVDLEVDFVSKVQNTLKSIDHCWDVILLSGDYTKDIKRKHNPKTGLQGSLFFFGMYGFLVNGAKSARKLSLLLENCPIDFQIDIYFGNLAAQGKIKAYAFTTPIASHLGNVFQSTIPTSCHVGPRKLKNSLYAITKKLNN